MATLKGYAITGSGVRTIRIRIPRFDVSGLTAGKYINSLSFNIPMRLSSREDYATGTYNVTLVLCKKIAYVESKTGGWGRYKSSSVSYWGTDNSSGTYWIHKGNYETIIGTENILGKAIPYSIEFTEKGKNTTISFTLENLSIPTDDLIGTGELGLAVLYEDNAAIEFAGGQTCTGTITELSAPTGTLSGNVSSVANGSNNSSLTVNEPIAGYHRMKVSWSYNKTDAKSFSLQIKNSLDREIEKRSVSSSGTEYFEISDAGTYSAIVYAENDPNNNNFQIKKNLGSLTFYSYTITKKYSSSPVKYYTSSGTEITGDTTTTSAIKAQWPSDSFQLKRNDSGTSAYSLNYNLNSSRGDSFGAELLRNYTLNENSSITFNTLNAYLYDSNTNSRVGAPATYSISRVISRGTNAVASAPVITDYLTKSGKIVYSTIRLSISNSTATIARISYFSDTNVNLGFSSQSLVNGSATFTFYSPGKKLKKISFNFGDGVYFSFNGSSVTNATYTVSDNPKEYLTNWGITPLITIDGNEPGNNNKLLKNLVFKITGYDEPQSFSYHTVSFTLSQGTSSVSLGNYNLTNNYEYTLNRSNSILNNFTLGSEITFTYTINSTDTRYPINGATSSTTGYSSNIKFSIYEAPTFEGVNLSSSEIEKYSLTTWNNSGTESYSSTKLSLRASVPSGLTGGTYKWNISAPSGYLIISSSSGNGSTIPTFTITTNEDTPLQRISIVVTLTYTLNGQELMNETKETYLTVKDSRNPYIPNLAVSLSNTYTANNKQYFIPNHSLLKINSGLNNIELIGGTATLNFYFITKNTSDNVIIERGNVQTVTYSTSTSSYTFPSSQIPSIIFTENNESKLTIGLKLVVTESNGRSTTKNFTTSVAPAYIATPKINSLVTGQTTTTEGKRGTLTVNYSLNTGVLSASSNFELKILAEMNKLNGTNPSRIQSFIKYSNATGNSKMTFSEEKPDNGYMNATLVMVYKYTDAEGIVKRVEVSPSSLKRVGFAKEVGEIAIRKKRVGFHGEPPENHSVAIYAVSNAENAYILSFYDGGIQLGGFQVKNGTDIVFSAGKWE